MNKLSVATESFSQFIDNYRSCSKSPIKRTETFEVLFILPFEQVLIGEIIWQNICNFQNVYKQSALLFLKIVPLQILVQIMHIYLVIFAYNIQMFKQLQGK